MAANGEQSEESGFDLNAVELAVSRCRQEDGGVVIDRYIEAYDQLVQFFLLLGSVFKFVVSDIISKLGILRHHRQGSSGDQYLTVQSMIQYEVSKELARAKTSPLSGSRTLLRLHRALLFIMRLFNDISKAGADDSLSNIVWKAYDETIAQYHTWLIRRTVGMAVYAVPTRHNLLKKVQKKGAAGLGSEEEIMAAMGRIVTQIQPVYDEVQKLYADNNILDLP